MTDNDPYIWLEDKDGAKALAWVEAENARTLPRLESDPRYAAFYAEALAIASATDRIPMPSQEAGRIVNFWRDKEHPQGLLRWTTEADYLTATPQWKTLIDVDALSRAEGKKWVFKGAQCLQPEERLCLVALSEGGEDAISYREFDMVAGQFVAGGFALPKSKQGAAWVDKDTLLVSRDWGDGTLTASSYPFVVKLVKRGQPIEAATEVFRGQPGDQLGTYASSLRDAKGNRLVTVERRTTFFGGEKFVWTPAGTRKLDMPARAFIDGLVDGRVIVSTSDDWGAIKAGSVAWLPLAEVERGELNPRLLWAPTPRQSVQQVATTRDRVIVAYIDNVRGRADVLAPTATGWSRQAVPLPENMSVGVASTTDRSNLAFLSVNGFATPTTLATLDVASPAAPKVVKTLPARFDAAGMRVEQFEATSSDGTKVPYFVVLPKGAKLDGTTPTLMTAYGGFQLARLPTYLGSTGKVWLERGGAFVLANIRGGGEFGPAWHDAGRKTKRQVIFDDFASVARDLFTRRVTSAQKLGIYGGSNGGLLMGVQMTQQPQLWRAVAIQVPLLDMIRYEQIAAGASWVDEYGSVSVPEERAFLEKTSPYQNLKRGAAYPEPYIWTTTKDDRVGPQHARKFAARMKEYGLPYLFYEDTAGGHSGDADIAQGARLQALQMVYFAQKLMGPAAVASK
ncbi:prolyl oligopeptidase family serine peptidase [Sphingomonas sp.]|uniref:prolyl oligopeptidase family serine peptidase n=1 Tax=Sphingomonas sp. TaxID=28214 RepID=UPI002D803872|nr:prolyl oligopeptidase family serine peptidase [Sphingomonas sp.]HEU0045130.1 prolyl oligopeptidase family serine peptidase [Sphingomonas sp.]